LIGAPHVESPEVHLHKYRVTALPSAPTRRRDLLTPQDTIGHVVIVIAADAATALQIAAALRALQRFKSRTTVCEPYAGDVAGVDAFDVMHAISNAIAAHIERDERDELEREHARRFCAECGEPYTPATVHVDRLSLQDYCERCRPNTH
jgi:hypothetical protein